jgi:AraC-like DNA-binding protein
MLANMGVVDEKNEIENAIGQILTKGETVSFCTSSSFGNYRCKVENLGAFAVFERTFAATVDDVTIPFSYHEAAIHMLFSLNGQSVFFDRRHPFILSESSHSLNFFNPLHCRIFLDKNRQHNDMGILITKDFYRELIHNELLYGPNNLLERVQQGFTFNTINQNKKIDPGIAGLLQNLTSCPFEGEMRAYYIKEHVRSLLLLQTLHFHEALSYKLLADGKKLSTRDKDILFELKNYLDKNFLTPTSLDHLSKRFGINEFKLKHGFRQIFGTSPLRHVQHKRLMYAMALLRDTDRCIHDISRELGYRHPTNFTLAFRKAFGRAPQDYRLGKNDIIDREAGSSFLL